MNDPLLGNKLAAAMLTAPLLFFGLPQLASALLGEGHHNKPGHELHLAYPVDYKSGLASAGASAAPAEVPLAVRLAGASASAGERRAVLCKSCHTFDEGGANGTGPNLWNIVGRDVGASSGFSYSGALKAFGGVWTYERLDGYLENSQSYLPGTVMVQRFPKDNQRADILAYLQSLSPSPVPFPEPPAMDAAAQDASSDHGGAH